jgi:hypothetical protein
MAYKTTNPRGAPYKIKISPYYDSTKSRTIGFWYKSARDKAIKLINLHHRRVTIWDKKTR